ncbi:MAG: hypothetical protein Kow00109_18600 [Acidobacteriota bacterium]
MNKSRTRWLLPAVIALFLAVPGLAERVKLQGYAEYRKGDWLIVDGQRVEAHPRTRFKGKGIADLQNIPLGYEVKVRGTRQPDGVVLADEVEAKPNGVQMFEPQVLQATNHIEELWLKEGRMFVETEEGKKEVIGRILETGPPVERVRRITGKLLPPYVPPERVRVRVVDTEEWNASAMGNGSIWVYRGLIEEMNDDEMAIILGHELAHYTHEHSRRGAGRALLGQIGALGALLAGRALGDAGGQVAGIGGLLAVTAWQSGYSRDMEDQADRVGLRYAYEGGFDVYQGPRLWERFREKYGEPDKVTNFFVGSHSRPSDRIRNIEKELAINYPRSRTRR